MTWWLALPSFWPEPHDPWAWQRALRAIAAVAPVPDPRPCWQRVLPETLSRRSVPGLYGLRAHPAPAVILGIGLLDHQGVEGWSLSTIGQELVSLDRDSFAARLGDVLVRRSAWVRLTLRELAAARWQMPRGVAPLVARRQLRVNEDLIVPRQALRELPQAKVLLGELFNADVDEVQTSAETAALSALHAPLYLLHVFGWIGADGRPTLPDGHAGSLEIESTAAILRRITKEEQDPLGFVPVAKVASRLWSTVRGNGTERDVDAWTDAVIGGAIEAGTIEVHAWAAGQPRHGRGLYGDRDRKLVYWTIHEDFELPPARAHRSGEIEP